MADSSFDVVSKLDRQEVDNAVNQTAKEIANRYDFRGVDAAITLSGRHDRQWKPNSASRVMAILDVLQSKLIRRGLSLKVLDYKDREPEGLGQALQARLPPEGRHPAGHREEDLQAHPRGGPRGRQGADPG